MAADLSAQAEALDVQLRAEEVAERQRHEVGQVRLIDRLRPAVGSEVLVTCVGQVSVQGRLTRVAEDALLIREPLRECLIAAAGVLSIGGVSRLSGPADGSTVEARIGLRVMLRAIARDRSPVRISLFDGSALDGTIDRVGADFLELAAHAPAEARRRGAVREVIVLPLAALVAVRRDGA